MAIVALALGLAIPSVYAKAPLFIFSALLLMAVAISKLQRERLQDAREEARDRLLEQLADRATPKPLNVFQSAFSIVPSVRVVQAYKDRTGQIRLGRDIDQDNSYVVLMTLRNEPSSLRPSRALRSLTASISYENSDSHTAYWLNAPAPSVDLEIHGEQSIAFVYVVAWTPTAVVSGRPMNGWAAMIADDRRAATREMTYICFATELGSEAPERFTTHIFSISLAEGGRVVAEGDCEVRLTSTRPEAKLLNWRTLPQGSAQFDIRYPGFVADVQVAYPRLARYAIALDVEVTNFADTVTCLTSDLLIQWGNPMVYKVRQAESVRVDAWESMLVAFDLPRRAQLLFPLRLEGKASAVGHIVFEIPLVGAGVEGGFDGTFRDPDEDSEKARERHSFLRFNHWGEPEVDTRRCDVTIVFAPRLDGLGVVAETDLAVAGSAATWIPNGG